jgi:hypothetical protein
MHPDLPVLSWDMKPIPFTTRIPKELTTWHIVLGGENFEIFGVRQNPWPSAIPCVCTRSNCFSSCDDDGVRTVVARILWRGRVQSVIGYQARSDGAGLIHHGAMGVTG